MTSNARVVISAEDNTAAAVASAKRNLLGLQHQTQLSAKEMAFAMRQVPAQVTDIVTSLASGQKPLTVLLQQGGQLKDTFGGVIPAAKALGGYIAGLINPVTILAGAAGALFIAYEQGAREGEALNKVLIMTGNYAGQTASSLNEMAKSIAKSGGTRGEAADTLVQLISTGKVANDQLVTVGRGAVQMAKVTGQSVKEVVAEFVRLGEEPAEASEKLNREYHYLTESVYEQIRALEEQGRHTAAASVAQEALASAMIERGKRVQENLGFLERSWNAVAGAAKGAWDSMLGIGREATIDERIAKLQEELRVRGKRWVGRDRDEGVKLGDAKIQTQIDFLQGIRRENSMLARRDSDRAVAQQEGVDSASRVAKLQDQAKGVAAVNRELEKYRADIERIRAVNPNSALLDPKAIAAGEAAIRKAHQGTVRSTEYSIDASIKALQGKLQEEERSVKSSLDQIKADYDTGLLTTKQYLDKQYEAKQSSLERELAIVRQQAEIARGKKNIAAVEQYKNEEKKILDEIEANFVHHANAVTVHSVKAQRAVQAYSASLSAQFRTRQAAIDDSLAGAGLSDRARQERETLIGVRREYDAKAEQLRIERQKGEANGGISEEVYQAELADLKDYYSKRLSQEQDYNAKAAALRGDWTVGARKAYADYAEAAADYAGQANKAFSNAMQGMEDALVNFAMTGKLNFKSLANSIIADLARMQAKKLITGLFGDGKSLGGGGGTIGGFFNWLMGGAGGGSTPAPVMDAGSVPIPPTYSAKGNVFNSPGLSAYSNKIVNQPTLFAFARGAGVMGEAGPEAIMPLRRGRDGRLGVEAPAGGQGSSVTVNNYNTFGDVASMQQVSEQIRQSERRTIAGLQRSMKYGRG